MNSLKRLFLFTSCVKFFEGLELLNEGLVLVLEHGDPVLKTLDVLLLFPPALPGRLPVLLQSDLPLPETSRGHHKGPPSVIISRVSPGSLIRRAAQTRGSQRRHGGYKAQALTLVCTVLSLSSCPIPVLRCHLVVPYGLGVVQGVQPVTGVMGRGHAHCPPAPSAGVQSLHPRDAPAPVTQQGA